MRAFVFAGRKSPLLLTQITKSVPRDNEVLVKIKAASVNAADYRSMQMGIVRKGKVMGADVAGVVEVVGKKVTLFSVGDEVCGDLSGCGFGSFAEYVAVPENVLANKPPSVSFAYAAAVPLAGVTALQALRKGNIQPGHRVLLYGSGGGVGAFVIQLAKYFGAEVTAVCSENNAQLAKDLGADYVLGYSTYDLAAGDKKYDLILAVNGRQSLSYYRRVMAAKGVFVVVGGALSQVIKTMLFGKLLSMGSKKMLILAAKPSAIDLQYLMDLVETGKVRPVLDRSYSFAETADAVQYLSKGHARGKVVIYIE